MSSGKRRLPVIHLLAMAATRGRPADAGDGITGEMRHSRLCAILLLCATLLAACSSPGGGSATPPRGATASPTIPSEGNTNPTAPPAEATATPAATATETPVAAPPTSVIMPTTAAPTVVVGPESTATPGEAAPTPTPTLPPIRGALRVEQWGYSQAEAYAEVSWGFLVSNQDHTSAVLDTAYVLTFIGDTGETIKADEGYIDVIMPGAEIGIGGSTFLPEGAIARSMRVDLRPGYLALPSTQPAIVIDDVTWYERSLFSIATGVASVDYDRQVEDIEVYAVGFDRDGAIIGGGYAYVPFILPGEPVGVEVSIPSVGKPARIELYPVMTAATVHADEVARASSEQASISVDKQGWGIVASSGEVGWGFLLHNPSESLAVEPVLYQVTAWAADGSVLATNASYVSVLLPGERLGVGGSVFTPDGAVPDRVDVQVLGRAYSEVNASAGMLQVSDVQLVPDTFTPRATGIVANGLDVDLSAVEVFAVGYDAADAIIGGGFAFVEALPAHGEAPVEVALAVGGEPARVELYATLSSSSQIP